MSLEKVLDKITDDTLVSENEYSHFLDKSEFGPLSYNKISSPILKIICKYILEIRNINGGISNENNILIIFYNKLLVEINDYYFNVYESIIKLNNERKIESFEKIKKKYINFADLNSKLYRKIYLKTLNSLTFKDSFKIGYQGHTDIHWQEMISHFNIFKTNFKFLEEQRVIQIPYLPKQIQICKNMMEEINSNFFDTINTKKEKFRTFDIESFICNNFEIKEYNKQLDLIKINFLLTGNTPSPYQLNLNLIYQKKNVPHIYLAHGISHKIFNEPCLSFLDNASWADMKISYGNIPLIKKNKLIDFDQNIWGKEIIYLSREDQRVKEIKKDLNSSSIAGLRSLSGKKLIYYTNLFDGKRYGPHSSVHPIIYFEFQIKLINWLESKGAKVILKMHPKRISNMYDPVIDRNDLNNKKLQELDIDGIIIDFPTSSLGLAISTDKPVLYFELQIRRVYEKVRQLIKDRCHYALVNINNPQGGFDEMEADLNRDLNDNFSKVLIRTQNKNHESKEIKHLIENFTNME